MDKKITLATFKSFVRKNYENLYISNQAHFDGMTDCVQESECKEFKKCTTSEWAENFKKYTLGILGIWLVLGSRDYFSYFEEENFSGIRVYNCCGRFKIAIKKN